MECQFLNEKIKGQGYRTSKISTVHSSLALCLLTDRRSSSRCSGADCMVGPWVWPGISKRHAAQSNCKDGRIACRRRHIYLFADNTWHHWSQFEIAWVFVFICVSSSVVFILVSNSLVLFLRFWSHSCH